MPQQPHDITNEVWRPLKKYPEYWVSNLGRAMSRKYVRARQATKDLILKIQWLPNGYGQFRVYAQNAGGGKGWEPLYIHRAVYEVFKPDDPLKAGLIVHHRDSNTRNNKISNLKQMSYSRNLMISDRWKNPTHQGILVSRKLRAEGMTYKKIADIMGVSSATIWRWCNNFQGYLKEMNL